jgi:hypothetical protein
MVVRLGKREHKLILFKLEHEDLAHVAAKARVVPEDAPNEVLADKGVPVDELLQVDFQ